MAINKLIGNSNQESIRRSAAGCTQNEQVCTSRNVMQLEVVRVVNDEPKNQENWILRRFTSKEGENNYQKLLSELDYVKVYIQFKVKHLIERLNYYQLFSISIIGCIYIIWSKCIYTYTTHIIVIVFNTNFREE